MLPQKIRFKEGQIRHKQYDTEPRKTRKRGQFSASHNLKTIKQTPRDSNADRNC